MKFGIVTDSGCDLKRLEVGKTCSYERVPLTVSLDEQDYIDDENLDTDAFMKKMKESQSSKSAAPSPNAWYNAFLQADEVFAVTITSSLSGSYNSAIAGREMALEEYPEKKIHIFDSLSAGPELTILILKIQELIQEGKSFEEIVETVEDYQNRTHLAFVLESIENFIKNGRVNKVVGRMAGLLGIKILGRASTEGELEVLEKCRGKKGIEEKILEQMIGEGFCGGKVVISHCFHVERAERIKELIMEKFPSSQISIMPTSGLCCYYAEEKGVLVGFES